MVSVPQPPTSSSADLRTMHMVPCWMMALSSLRWIMPMSKKPAYSLFISVFSTVSSPSRWSWGACTSATFGSAKAGTRSFSQSGSTA